jgi:hypothetical protein
MSRNLYKGQGITEKFQNKLVAGLLKQQREERRESSRKSPIPKTCLVERDQTLASHGTTPETKYTDAKGAAQHLGISRSKFFRLRSKGHFTPSPITGLYNFQDLDREARGN